MIRPYARLSLFTTLAALLVAAGCSEPERNFPTGDDADAGDSDDDDSSGADDDADDDSSADDDSGDDADDTTDDDDTTDAGADDDVMDDDVSPDGGLMMSCSADEDCDDGNLCNGSEGCIENACVAGSRADEGTQCELADAEGNHYCIAGNCTASRCGDGILDTDAEEVCDDGNTDDGDGCENDCTYSCVEDAECDDSNFCNGDESCGEDHYCVAGTNAADGLDCGTDRSCNAGRCVPIGCGDGVVSSTEQCDDSNLEDGDGCDSDCTFTCEADEECNDLNACNGEETCNPDTHTCVAGEALNCDDENACTADSCDPESGKCINELIDEDGDKHASESLGSCGDDCDDSDATVYAGAEELCDNKDNNCNGDKDETAPTWYVDCDGDGYAKTGAVSIKQCDAPSPPTAYCEAGQAGQWIALAPGPGTTDCWDKSPAVRPMTATESNSAWSSSAIAGQSTQFDYDYNCDTVEEKRYTLGNVSTSARCGYIILEPVLEPLGDVIIGPVPKYCPGTSGYTGEPPACGASGTWTYCTSDCTRTTRSQVQQCR